MIIVNKGTPDLKELVVSPADDVQKISSVFSKLPVPTSTVILSHIQADFYISDATGQEGNEAKNSLEAILYHLKTLPAELMTDPVCRIIKEFERYHNLLEKEALYRKHDANVIGQSGEKALVLFEQEVLKDIRSLNPGERCLFPGGWLSAEFGASSGHAIIHWVEKQAEGTYILATVNTGGGLPFFHDYEVDPHGYRRYSPIVIHKNIQEANLFNHLRSLLDLRLTPLNASDCEHGAHIIYDSILPAFKGERVEVSSELVQVMRAQRSGTCSYKVCNALLKLNLDKTTYKRIKIQIRLQNLKTYLNEKIETKSRLTPSEDLHLTHDLEKLIRELKKDSAGLSADAQEIYFAEIADLQKKQKQIAFLLKPGQYSIIPFQNAPIFCMENLPCPEMLSDLAIASKILPRIQVPLSHSCPDKKEVLEHLTQAALFAETLYSNAQYSDVIYFVNATIGHLPFPVETLKGNDQVDPFWGEFGERNEEEISQLIILLTKLNERLFQSCFHMQRSLGDEVVTAFTSYCIQVKLLETLLGYQRDGKGMALLSLEDCKLCHIRRASNTNDFAHDVSLNERAHLINNFMKVGSSINAFMDLLTLQESNNIYLKVNAIKNSKELNKIRDEIKQSALKMGIVQKWSSEAIDYSLLLGMMLNDLGQFQILPSFLASLNKQIFILTYFLANKDFISRCPGCEQSDAFTLQTFTQEQIEKEIKQWGQIAPCISVKGVGEQASSLTHSYVDMQKKYSEKIAHPNIREFVCKILDKRGYQYINPNLALKDFSQYQNLSQEDAQELITLVNTPSNMLVWQALAFFSRSIDKLQSRDYQLLFELCIFPRLVSEIKKNSEFSAQLLQFILSGMGEFQAPSQIDGFLFLIRVGMHLESLTDLSAVLPKGSWESQVRNRLIASKEGQEKRALEAQLAHTLVATSVAFDGTHVEEILRGLSHLQAGRVPFSMRELNILRPVMEWMHNHERELQALLSKGNTVNALCSAIAPKSFSERQWKEMSFPIYTCDDQLCRVNLLTGEVWVQDAAHAYLPREIVEDPDFCHLFPNKNPEVRALSFNRYSFVENGREFRMEKLPTGELAIEQKEGEGWLRFLPLSFLPPDFPEIMKDSYTHWLDPRKSDQQVLRIQDSRFNPCFVGTEIQDSGWFVIRPHLQQKNLVSSEIFLKDHFSFGRFEESGFICGWKESSKQVDKVDLPRYGLHFTLSEGKGPSSVYACKERPGYHVAECQDLPQLPFISSCLVLENNSGKKKVLIPLETSFLKFSQENFLRAAYILRKKNIPFSFLEIELNSKGKPKNLTQQQALYLAYLAIAEKEYVEADKFLKIAEGLSGAQSEEIVCKFCALIEDSANVKPNPDNHPKAKALALRAGMIALKNLRYRYKSSDPHVQRKIQALLEILAPIYKKYHAADSNAGYFALSLSEERKLLQELFNHHLLSLDQFDRFIYLQNGQELARTRRKADGLPADAYESHAASCHENWTYFNTDLLPKMIQEAGNDVWTGRESLIGPPLTRPKGRFLPYFLHVCLHREAYSKDPEMKAELDYYLQFIKWTESSILFRECLLDVLTHPESYANFLSQLKDLEKNRAPIDSWIKNLAQHFHQRFESRKENKQSSVLFPAAPPIQLPDLNVSSGVLHSSIASTPPVWTNEQLISLFEVKSAQREEPLPDLDDQAVHLETHQRRQLVEFNQAKAKFYREKPPVNSYHLKNPTQLEKELVEAIQIAKQRLKHQKKTLLSLANSMPRDPDLSLQVELEKAGGQRRELSLEDLIVLYLRGSEAEILKQCPGFEGSPKLCKTLLDSVAKFLILTVDQQQREKALIKVLEIKSLQKKLENSPGDVDLEKEIENTSADLYTCMAAKRVYSIGPQSEFLTFEYRSKILLRKNQTEIISVLTNPEKTSETELILQLMMGEGKTKVITPLLAAKHADGTKLSLVIVPAFNFETNLHDLQAIGKNASLLEPMSFHFDRSTPFTEEELRGKLWGLQNAILNRTYVLTTSESLLCVKLKHKEVRYQIRKGELQRHEAEPKLKLLGELLKLIKKAWSLIDEPDEVLGVRREVNFPLGAYHTVRKEKTRLIQKIYEVLLLPEMEQWTHLQSNKPEAFSKEAFFEHVAPKIADHLIKGWQLNKLQAKDLKDYLLGKLEGEALASLSEHPQRGLIALAKEILTVFLPYVLSRKGNEHFGLSHETNAKYPIPYKANNTPEESSELGNIHETLLFAPNIYIQDGLKDIHTDELIGDTCRRIRLESKDLSCRLSETPSFKHFTQTYGVADPFAVSAEDRKTLAQSVRKKQEALFDWLERFVYPEVKTTRLKINANALTLIEMLAHAQGFTATPWNRLTFHPRLQKAGHKDEGSIPESDLRILHAIYQKVREGGIHSIRENTPIEVLDRILKDFQFDCLIDVGALLNGITNTDVAQKIKEKSDQEHISGVIYFNEKNELVIEIKGIAEPIAFSSDAFERLIRGKDISYYDQRHTAGTDIKQRPQAKALLTFSKNIISQLTQGAMRMRQLLSSQSIEIIFPEEIKSQMAPLGQNVTFDALVAYAIVQQTNRLAEDLVRCTRMALQHSIRSEIDTLIESEENIEIQVQLDAFFEPMIVDINTDDDYQEFGACFSLDDTLPILNSYRQDRIAAISSLMSDQALSQFSGPLHQRLLAVRGTILAHLNNYIMPDAELLFPKIPRQNLNQKTDAKVEVEKEIEVNVEAKVEKINSSAKDYLLWGRHRWEPPVLDALFFTPDRAEVPKNCPVIVSVRSLMSAESNLIFNPDLCTTQLFYQAMVDQKQPLFGQGSQKHLYQFAFIVEEDGATRGLIVDPAEAGRIRKWMDTDTIENRKIYLIDLASGLIQKKGSGLTPSEKEKCALLEVQAKFFNGEVNYTQTEWRYLKAWIDPLNRKSVKELFEKIVLSHVGLEKKYQESLLKQYLHNQG